MTYESLTNEGDGELKLDVCNKIRGTHNISIRSMSEAGVIE